jgi:mono/diheme cytochrome c family protein
MSWRTRRLLGLLLAGAAAGSRPAAAYEPRINYMLQCMGCHTPDGSGEPGRVPSVKTTLVPFAKSADGRRFLVQVPGAAQSTLSDAELAELLNWMIQNLSTAKPAHFARFTAAEVASSRRTPLVEVRATRERLLRIVATAPAP